MTWPEKITALQSLLKRTGSLWTGTRLSGYAESGPYHCGNCIYLVGHNQCKHPVVIADPEILGHGYPRNILPIVNAAHGCCEFVEPRR